MLILGLANMGVLVSQPCPSLHLGGALSRFHPHWVPRHRSLPLATLSVTLLCPQNTECINSELEHLT